MKGYEEDLPTIQPGMLFIVHTSNGSHDLDANDLLEVETATPEEVCFVREKFPAEPSISWLLDILDQVDLTDEEQIYFQSCVECEDKEDLVEAVDTLTKFVKSRGDLWKTLCGERITLEKNRIERNLFLGYWTTCHRSQGLEFNHKYAIAESEKVKHLPENWCYTALSRTRDPSNIVIVR